MRAGRAPQVVRSGRVTIVSEAVCCCAACPARDSGPFCRVTGKARQRIEQVKSTRTYRQGEHVFTAGERPGASFVVRTGRFKVYRTWACGQEHVIRLVGTGAILGYRPMLADAPYLASAEAVEASTLCILPAQAVLELLRDVPGMAFELLLKLAKDSRASENLVMDLLHGEVRARAARLLLLLLDDGKRAPGSEPVLSHCPRRQEMARMIGTTPETFSRVLRGFVETGMISLSRGSIRIHERDLLHKVSEERCTEWLEGN